MIGYELDKLETLNWKQWLFLPYVGTDLYKERVEEYFIPVEAVPKGNEIVHGQIMTREMGHTELMESGGFHGTRHHCALKYPNCSVL